MKTCNECSETKEFDEYSRQDTSNDGRRHTCKECSKKKNTSIFRKIKPKNTYQKLICPKLIWLTDRQYVIILIFLLSNFYESTNRRKDFVKCKNCNIKFYATDLVWREDILTQKMKCTMLCYSCSPIFNSRCCICNLIKSNSEFYSRQLLTSTKKQKCKQCFPDKPKSQETKEKSSKYRKIPKNRKRATEYQKKANKIKTKHDVAFKLIKNLRSRLGRFIKGKVKSGSAADDLGCTAEELISYFESLFLPGMTWDNYGNKSGQWSMDHIYPISRVNIEDREELLKICHYTNLQPMWHIDNIKKGNKIPKNHNLNSLPLKKD